MSFIQEQKRVQGFTSDIATIPAPRTQRSTNRCVGQFLFSEHSR